MIFRHPNCHHTYPKTDSLEYSLAVSHNSYSYPPTLLVLYSPHDTLTVTNDARTNLAENAYKVTLYLNPPLKYTPKVQC